MTDIEADNERTETPPAGKFDPQEARRLLGLTDTQFKFAQARLRGMNQSQAAREAGYKGDDDQIRSAGNKAARSSKVISFMAWAEREGSGIPDEPCNSDELKKILSRHARSADKNTAIRAMEVLHRIGQADAERNETGSYNPEETLKDIAKIDIVLADRMAREFNVPLALTEDDRQRLNAAKQKFFLKLSAELGASNANGGATRGTEATQQAAASSIDGSAKPIAEKQNGALVGAEA